MWLGDLRRDAVELAQIAYGDRSRRAVARALFATDSFRVLSLYRLRVALMHARIPLLGHLLRIVQGMLYGIEIDKRVRLGHGTYFVHTFGTVIGGDARVGDRVQFLGSNTVGTNKDNGYPIIGDDVTVGVGARILGPVHVGDRAVIGANAVVLSDVPAGSVAVGVPARVVKTPDRQRPRSVGGAHA
jgi:serine O-acetyltransferase